MKVKSWYLGPEGQAKENLEKFGKEKTLEIIKGKYVDWAPEIAGFLRQGDLQGLKQRLCTSCQLAIHGSTRRDPLSSETLQICQRHFPEVSTKR